MYMLLMLLLQHPLLLLIIMSPCCLQVVLLLLLQAMVNVQMLSELEEVIQYKLVPERQDAIKQMWWLRLQVCIVTALFYCLI